ncbi:DUF3562 domain-containing protein [Microbacterium sp. ProA8]|jgi:hypothetical protein|uniref:three-helix bundle dimerization domain-containing protein n=1 Tax=Microbacterium chionoecetis TaxID=3153754 RepID=UPI0032631603
MDNSDALEQPAEAISIDAAIHRIATRYPDIDRSRIESLVSDSAHRLDGARVRDFIPVLVEHDVMEQLRAEAEPVPISELDLESTLVDDRAAHDRGRPDPQEVERKSKHTGLLHGDLTNG